MSRRGRGRPPGSLRTPGRVALLIWYARRQFRIRTSKIIDALGYDTGRSQAYRYVERAAARVEADIKAKEPLFYAPPLTWRPYATLPPQQRRRALLARLRALYPTREALLDKIREMPTVKQRHQRRELAEGRDAGRDRD